MVLLEEIVHWGQALRDSNFAEIPVCFLCFVLVLEDVSV